MSSANLQAIYNYKIGDPKAIYSLDEWTGVPRECEPWTFSMAGNDINSVILNGLDLEI